MARPSSTRVAADMLSCEDARRALWPLDRPREFVADEEDARVHLKACDACRSFFSADAKLRGILSRYGGGAKAPESLRTRILGAIAREQRPSRPQVVARSSSTLSSPNIPKRGWPGWPAQHSPRAERGYRSWRLVAALKRHYA